MCLFCLVPHKIAPISAILSLDFLLHFFTPSTQNCLLGYATLFFLALRGFLSFFPASFLFSQYSVHLSALNVFSCLPCSVHNSKNDLRAVGSTVLAGSLSCLVGLQLLQLECVPVPCHWGQERVKSQMLLASVLRVKGEQQP